MVSNLARSFLLLLFVALAAGLFAVFLYEFSHLDGPLENFLWMMMPASIGSTGAAYFLARRIIAENNRVAAENEKRIRELFDITSDWYWEMGPDLRYTVASERFADHVSRSASDYIGKTRFEMIPQETLDAEPVKWRQHREALEKRLPFRDLEYSLTNQDGETLDIWVSGNPMFGKNGEFLGYRGVSKDITERATAQRQIREEEARLRNILEQAPIGIGISRMEDGFLYYANQKLASQAKLPLDQLIGKSVAPNWKDENLRNEFIKTFVAEGRVEAREAEIVRMDGSTFWSLISWDSVKYDNKDCILFWNFEITKMKAAENDLISARDRAEAASRAKSAFLASMSHELRTPLNAIIGFTGAIKSEVFGPLENEKYVDYIKDINASGEHLLGLINDILDLSSIEADKITLELETFYPKSVFRPCYDIVKGFAEQSGVELIGVKKSKRQITADKSRLRQILLNLMSNAIKFNRPGGKVEFGCINEQDDFVRLFIKDTGLGIDKADQHTLFEPFTRLHEGITPVSGTGIGLSISKKIIERMGGNIGVESTVGEGSTFWVDVPACEPKDAKEKED